MQSQNSKKSAYLFQVLLDSQELTQLIRLDDSLLKKLIRVCCKHMQKQRRKRGIYSFLANYKRIMQLHSSTFSNSMSVNLSLHFAILFTYHLLTQNQQPYAKRILKETEQYLEIEGCDLILISTCMNNLALLHLRSQHPRKALKICLKGISAIEDHLDRLREVKDRKRMTEDGVIFINLLLVAKRSLTRILNQCTSESKTYEKLLKMMNNLGYHFSLKYLGASSFFTTKFQQSDSICLPIYDESYSQISQQASENKDEFELKLAEGLSNILNILTDMKLQPEVYYIKQHLVESKENSLSRHTQPIQPIEPQEPQRSIAHIEHIIVDQWDTEISILQTNQPIQLTQLEFQFMGHLKFQYIRGRKKREKLITEQSLIKIVHAINVYDVLPYEIELKRISTQEFIKKALKNFLMASEEGDMHILPRARPIVDPFQLTFCGQKTFVMVNHIRFRKFRVAICPINSCDTLYLEIEFKYKQSDLLFNLKEEQHQFINSISSKEPTKENYMQQYKYAPAKQIRILSSEFHSKINSILTQFQAFLIQQEDNHISEMTTVSNLSEDYVYYQYTEFKDEIGQFNTVKYRSNINQIEINIKNIFKTYTPAGQDYARGGTTYSPQQFLKEFAIPLKSCKRQILAFSQLILQKYNLKIYPSPLLQQEVDRYQQNAIAEVPITSKCYSRRFLPFQDYAIPVTIEVVSVNNEKPIGIRVTAYEPIKGAHSGLFIHIVPEYWERPLPLVNEEMDQKKEEDKQDLKVKRSTQDYNFKKCYFLTAFMEQQGFHLIFSRLTISNRTLEIKGIPHKFIRIDEILPSFPVSHKKDGQ